MIKDFRFFDDCWEYIQEHLKIGDVISHWSVAGQFEDKEFVILEISEYGLEIQNSEKASRQVSKKDFEKVFLVWEEYIQGKILRRDLRDIPNKNTTYVISLLHKFDSEEMEV